MNKIEYNFYYWGPYLWRAKLPTDFCEELLARSNSTVPEDPSRICSIISDVRVYNRDDDLHWFASKLTPYLETYLKTKNDYENKTEQRSVGLTSLWINFQHQHEVNPEHTHSEDLSFVIYLKVPPELIEENKRYTGRSAGPGGIKFRYGEKTDFTISDHYFMPEEGDIFIFPASLAHEVYSFNSDCERISVSGNLKYI